MNLRKLAADVYLALLRTGRHRGRLERDKWIEKGETGKGKETNKGD